MDIRKLTDTISVAPQIALTDIAELARLGFRTLINNRPDGEDYGQPSSAQIEAAARASGLEYHHQPVVSGRLGTEDVLGFRQLLAMAATPALAFCRSGTRSATLWALAQAGSGNADDVIAAAARAGYDLRGLKEVIERGI